MAGSGNETRGGTTGYVGGDWARRIGSLCAAGFVPLLGLAGVAGLLLIAGAQPAAAARHMFDGALGSTSGIGAVMRGWVALVIVGAGLLFTFRCRMWNIGVEGQIVMGAVGAMAAARVAAHMGWGRFGLVPAAVAAVAAGGAWAWGCAALRTRCGVSEIFGGLGLNFVAQGLAMWLIFGPWRRAGVASMSGTDSLPERLWLDAGLASPVSPIALGCALGVILAVLGVLRRSRAGLALDAAGQSPAAFATYGGSASHVTEWALAASGAAAGLVGFLQVTSVYHRLIPAISSNYGYLGLLVALLAGHRLWAVGLVALFFACVNVGSVQLPLMDQVDSSLGGVVQGVLVLSVLAAGGVADRLRRRSAAARGVRVAGGGVGR